MDSGNLRAVWREEEREVGIQFFGDGWVQVLISRQDGDGEIVHEAHRELAYGLLTTIEAAGLGRLLYE